MYKKLIVSDSTIKKYIKNLTEQEKSKNTITTYHRELTAFQMYLDEETATKEKVLSYKAMIVSHYSPSSCNVSIAALNSFFVFMKEMILS